MKSYFKIYYLLFLTALCFVSCQDETLDMTDTTQGDVITANSELSNLMLRTSSNRVSDDNIVDNSSCFSVELPVTVTVGNITITIENEEGFDELEEILENFDNEIPEFIFPITIISADYTETVIENQSQLETLLSDCEEEEDVIECVDFVYPISFSTLNTDFVIIDTIQIESNEALYEFLDDLDDNDDNSNLVALNFPVTLEFANGETETVNSNEELSNAISSVGDDCEIEDFDTCDPDDIRQKLKECVWELDDEIDDFDGLSVKFNSDFTLKITGQDMPEPITGAWEITGGDNGEVFLTLSNLTGLSDDLEGTWLVTDCEDDDEITIIKNNFELELEKDCNETECSLEEVKEYLQTCVWNAINVTDNQELSGYDLSFNENDELLITMPGAESITGNWRVISVTDGIYLSIGSVNAANIQQINGYWKLFECDENRLKFTDENKFIIMTQDCEDPQSDFDCFNSFDAFIQLCDVLNDGVETFDLTTAFANCTPFVDSVAYYTTLADANTESNAIANPQAYDNTSAPQIIYVRAEENGQFEIFEIELKLEDCDNGSCTEGDVDGILMNCKWKVFEFNGSEDLNIYELNFNEQQELVITNLNMGTTQTGTWTTSTDNNGNVIVQFENIFEGNIESITGNWAVVECTGEQLIFHRDNDQMTLDKVCD